MRKLGNRKLDEEGKGRRGGEVAGDRKEKRKHNVKVQKETRREETYVEEETGDVIRR